MVAVLLTLPPAAAADAQDDKDEEDAAEKHDEPGHVGGVGQTLLGRDTRAVTLCVHLMLGRPGEREVVGRSAIIVAADLPLLIVRAPEDALSDLITAVALTDGASIAGNHLALLVPVWFRHAFTTLL